MKEWLPPMILMTLGLLSLYLYFKVDEAEKRHKQETVTINTTVIDMSNSDTIIVVRDGEEKYKLIKLH